MVRHDLGALRGFYDALREQGWIRRPSCSRSPRSTRRTDVTAGGAGSAGPACAVATCSRATLRPGGGLAAGRCAASLGENRAARLTVYEIVEQFLGETHRRAQTCRSAASRCARHRRAARAAQRARRAGDGAPVAIAGRPDPGVHAHPHRPGALRVPTAASRARCEIANALRPVATRRRTMEPTTSTGDMPMTTVWNVRRHSLRQSTVAA